MRIFGVHLSTGTRSLTHSLSCSAASETESPRRNVVKAVRRVFWRIFLFYICGTLIIGMTVPSNDPRLLRPTGTAAQSPYIIAMERAGIRSVYQGCHPQLRLVADSSSPPSF